MAFVLHLPIVSYLSYLKSPVLDMKWENRDIALVEWANISKFSKLDKKTTPFRLLKVFFDDVSVDIIFGHTKLHSHREKVNISFEITNEKIRLFLSMLLLSGCHRFQIKKCIGRPPILLCKQGLIQFLVIHSSVFFGISIFVATNNLINTANSQSSFP